MEKSIDEVLEMNCTYDDEGNLKRDAFMKKKREKKRKIWMTNMKQTIKI